MNSLIHLLGINLITQQTDSRLNEFTNTNEDPSVLKEIFLFFSIFVDKILQTDLFLKII